MINDAGGINGRPPEIITEDDGTDPKRGAEVVEKFVNQHKVDVVYGTLFSHVVVGSAPTAGELKVPYYVVSEGYHVASGKMNRWCVQPGITDVRAQVTSVAPWIAGNLGKKVTMVFPDYAFGHDHRDFFTPAIAAQGGEVIARYNPPTSSFTLPAADPVERSALPRDGGTGVLTFVKKARRILCRRDPRCSASSTASRRWTSLARHWSSSRHYFWEGMPRYAGRCPDAVKAYRVSDNGARRDAKDRDGRAHVRLLRLSTSSSLRWKRPAIGHWTGRS